MKKIDPSTELSLYEATVHHLFSDGRLKEEEKAYYAAPAIEYVWNFLKDEGKVDSPTCKLVSITAVVKITGVL